MIRNEIILNKKTREIVNKDLFKFGVDGENLQENIIFRFEDEFVEGQARVEIELQDDTKTYIMIEQHGETYELPIKSVITKKGLNYMQLVITEGTDDEDIPIFKSKKFGFLIDESVNAVEEAPDGYDQWIDIANAKIRQMNEMLADLQNKLDTGYFEAKINGYNTIELVAGQNITIEQNENVLTISATGVVPYPDNVLQTSDGDLFMTSNDEYFVVKESV